MLDPAFRDQVLVNEARTEWKGSVTAWVGLMAANGFLVLEFGERVVGPGYLAWLAGMSVFLGAWFAAWATFVIKPPSDEAILTRWIPGARLGMWFCNAVTAGSVWVFMPAAEPELRALLLVLYAWYLIVQFAASTEATQVLRSAVILILGSLTAWLLVDRPPHFLPLVLFLPLFGATLLAIRRFIRQAVVKATLAQAAADRSSRELAAALVDLERERDAKTQFIRAASHDLQQPLQAAALFLNQVKPGPRSAGALSGVTRSLGVARGLVNAMLEHLKLESGLVRPDFARYSAGELFDRIGLTQGQSAEAAGIRLSFAGHGVELHADRLLLARAVENLVANAIRHSGGKRVLVGARGRGDHVILWVIDDGRGLPADEAARIFRPFEQGDHVGAAGGFGLGLASTRGLVELMSGTCGLDAGQTRGAAFYIRLARPGPDEVRCAA